jgi:oxygen-independent coproporphyrinogen-3 oxidase
VRPRHLYVHIPFCARRCTYCDFAIAVRRETPVADYLAALNGELHLRYPPTEPWTLDTVYLGGGTPSRLGAEGIARLLDIVRRSATIAPDAEVTIEANPDDVTASAAAGWRDAGINRLSLGAQSFDDRVLDWMHRTHDAGAIDRAVRSARECGIRELSMDLIFALPEALQRDWTRDLEMALALEPDHVSLYGLTVESATPLGRRQSRGDVVEAPEERYEAEYLEADRTLRSAGFSHYEVSNFALPGRRARHNSAYWMGVPYAGVGPAAHEYDGERRRWNVRAYAGWAARIGLGEDAVEGSESLSEESRSAESVYLGLRTSGGLRLAADERGRAERWVEAGWATIDSGVLTMTPAGWLRLDAIAADLTVLRSR